MYVQVKGKLQQQILEKKYEGYKLEEDGILTYKNIIYIPDVADLRRIVMDEIHQAPYFGHPGYQRQLLQTECGVFGQELRRTLLSIFQGA